ncbi:hypothetical protein CERZMDRAFT_84857 [Cercospora zeae-maydis SCOH1-5]|uniref:Uncharacterized protein n=1 Tax=Cercospora zeae-maydis SCOH1-5 TaxID=717836 RepID=A0A6A6FEK2_9PEZI|nr:hypothetical protein CERZMDRAFT_84857 [Cercospora zeae-maydis SCOH1-5]
MASDTRDPDAILPVLKSQFLSSLERIPEIPFGVRPSSAFYAGSPDQDLEATRDQVTTDRRTTSWLLALIVGLAVVGIVLGVALGVHYGAVRPRLFEQFGPKTQLPLRQVDCFSNPRTREGESAAEFVYASTDVCVADQCTSTAMRTKIEKKPQLAAIKEKHIAQAVACGMQVSCRLGDNTKCVEHAMIFLDDGLELRTARYLQQIPTLNIIVSDAVG